MAKRGRKPNPNKKREYFSDEEEMAVIMYLKTEDSSEKNQIYNEKDCAFVFYCRDGGFRQQCRFGSGQIWSR